MWCLSFGRNIFIYFVWDIRVMILTKQELYLPSFVINFCFSIIAIKCINTICRESPKFIWRKLFWDSLIFWKNFPWFALLRKSSVLEIKLTLLHDNKLSENIRFSQTKITEKVRFLIYFPNSLVREKFCLNFLLSVLWFSRDFRKIRKICNIESR